MCCRVCATCCTPASEKNSRKKRFCRGLQERIHLSFVVCAFKKRMWGLRPCRLRMRCGGYSAGKDGESWSMEGYSVLMSVYARETPAHLCAAMQSMIGQRVPPAEFVLVCDGALTPGLDAVVEAYRAAYPDLIKLLRLPENVGLGPALQRGLTECRCEWIARMDSDDISLPDRLEKQLSLLAADPSVSAVGGQIAEFTTDPYRIADYRIVPLSADAIARTAAFKNPMNHMTVVFRKSDVLAVGGYADMRGFEDYDLWVRLLAANKKLRNVADVCCCVRAGAGLYRRRGGTAYVRTMRAFERSIRTCGLISPWQYHRNVLLRFAAAVIPGKIRKFLVERRMREKTYALHERSGV